MRKSERLLQALAELEVALEEFRSAYTTWLARQDGGNGEAAALRSALEKAEARLDAARAILANAADEQSYP